MMPEGLRERQLRTDIRTAPNPGAIDHGELLENDADNTVIIFEIIYFDPEWYLDCICGLKGHIQSCGRIFLRLQRKKIT